MIEPFHDRIHALARRGCAALPDLVPVPEGRLQAHAARGAAGTGLAAYRAAGTGLAAYRRNFVDPSSSAMLDVWFHPESGERAYVRSR